MEKKTVLGKASSPPHLSITGAQVQALGCRGPEGTAAAARNWCCISSPAHPSPEVQQRVRTRVGSWTTGDDSRMGALRGTARCPSASILRRHTALASARCRREPPHASETLPAGAGLAQSLPLASCTSTASGSAGTPASCSVCSLLQATGLGWLSTDLRRTCQDRGLLSYPLLRRPLQPLPPAATHSTTVATGSGERRGINHEAPPGEGLGLGAALP